MPSSSFLPFRLLRRIKTNDTILTIFTINPAEFTGPDDIYGHYKSDGIPRPKSFTGLIS